jgi:hypothetical protein
MAEEGRMGFDQTVKRALGQHSFPFLLQWTVRRAFRRLTAWGRILPDFVIIGAQRCGTTSLYNYVADHPEVASAFMKETHFFDLHFAQGSGWYRAHFPTAVHRLAVQRLLRRRLVVGEATPYYLFYPHAARRVREAVPNAKLIVLLRNPIDRAYSHFHHEVSMGVEKASFEEAIAREEAVLPEETARVLADERYRSFAHFHYSYAARGLYADQLELWARLFGRDQLLTIKSEDFYADPATVVEQVFRFLDLPAWTSGTYRKYNLAQYANMEQATRERLDAFFRPHNQKLYDLLGVDFGWNG